jgi:hypothetical protein
VFNSRSVEESHQDIASNFSIKEFRMQIVQRICIHTGWVAETHVKNAQRWTTGIVFEKTIQMSIL